MTELVAEHQVERPYDESRARRQALVLLAVLFAAHTWAVWSYAGAFWDGHGRWLQAVATFPDGTAAYGDYWTNPPLALWILGALSSLTGNGIAGISVLTALLSAGALVVFHQMLSRAAPGIVVPGTLAAFVLAAAYANRFGPPLPLGTALPANLVGMVFLMVALTCVLGLQKGTRRSHAVGAGVAIGLAFFSAHALWIAALVLTAGALLATRGPAHRDKSSAALFLAALAATLAAGSLATLAIGGGEWLRGTVVGYADIMARAAASAPSWEQRAVEVAAAAGLGLVGTVALWLCLAIEDARAVRWAAGFIVVFLVAAGSHLGNTVAEAGRLLAGAVSEPSPTQVSVAQLLSGGISLPRASIALLDMRFLHHLFPNVLPPVLLVALFIRWKHLGEPELRNMVALFLGVAVAARVPGGRFGTDWYHILLDVPAYSLFLYLVAGRSGRGIRGSVSAALGIIILVSAYAYYSLGVGAFTRRGSLQPTETPRGAVRWGPGDAADYRSIASVLDGMDPARGRHLAVYGMPGGWGYFLDRESEAIASVAARAHGTLVGSAGPVLVDNSRLAHGAIAPWVDPWRPLDWGFASRRADLARGVLESLVEGCRSVSVGPEQQPRFVLYDCSKNAAPDSVPSPTPPGSSP